MSSARISSSRSAIASRPSATAMRRSLPRSRSRGELDRHALGRVALHRLAQEPHQPEGEAEAEARAEERPERPLEQRPLPRETAALAEPLRARPVPVAKAMLLITGLEKARYASFDAESTVAEMLSAVPSSASTRSSSALACCTVSRSSVTAGSVSCRSSSIDSASTFNVFVSWTTVYSSTSTARHW